MPPISGTVIEFSVEDEKEVEEENILMIIETMKT